MIFTWWFPNVYHCFLGFLGFLRFYFFVCVQNLVWSIVVFLVFCDFSWFSMVFQFFIECDEFLELRQQTNQNNASHQFFVQFVHHCCKAPL